MKWLLTAPLSCSSLNASQRNPCILTVYPVFLATDLFDYQGTQYLLVTDYYSKYTIVRKLNSTISAAVINHLNISRKWDTRNLNIRQWPRVQQSRICRLLQAMGHWPCDKLSNVSTNQRLRRVVSRTVKNLLRKAEALRQDPYLALLTYRTTPVDSNLPSPHLLNHKGYRTKLPCSGHLQSSQAFNSHREQLQNRQNTKRNQYDRQSTHELRRLNQGEQVAVFQPQTKTWIPAEMKEETGKPRSYIVKTTGGSELRHNRVPVEE